MIDVTEIEDKLSQRFMGELETEEQIIAAILGCKTREQYLKLLRNFSLDKMRGVCGQVYATNVDPVRVFKNIKPCVVGTDFI
jgi:hypothetical protein